VGNAIEITGLTKTFGPKRAVDDLNLVVPQQGLYGLIGPNGAGKTTAIRMIMSILFPDSGRISVLGRASALEAKDDIGYLPEERGVYRKMKVVQFLRYMGRLKGVDAHRLNQLIDGWLSRVGLADVAQKKCEELSKGMQQKIQFIAAVVHEPDLLILDEPFSGLDPINMRLLKELIFEQHERGATIIFSTHVMFQAEQMCQHIVMINEGRKVLDDSLANIRSNYDARSLLFEPLDPGGDVSAIEALPGVAEVEGTDGTYEITCADGVEPASLMRPVVEAVAPARIEIKRPSLEDVFIQTVARSSDASARDLDALRRSLRSDESPLEEVAS
jgi:ABC-2 type transport system ATP-binding protein